MNELCINVYGVEDDTKFRRGETVPLYLSQGKSRYPTIHLLMLETSNVLSNYSDDSYINPIYLFTWIKNLSRSVKSQFTKDSHRTFLCDRCLCHFRLEKSFEKHKQDCENINQYRMILPSEQEKILKFKNYRFKEKFHLLFLLTLSVSCNKFLILS